MAHPPITKIRMRSKRKNVKWVWLTVYPSLDLKVCRLGEPIPLYGWYHYDVVEPDLNLSSSSGCVWGECLSVTLLYNSNFDIFYRDNNKSETARSSTFANADLYIDYFAELVWTRKNHRHWPPSFRREVVCVLLLCDRLGLAHELAFEIIRQLAVLTVEPMVEVGMQDVD